MLLSVAVLLSTVLHAEELVPFGMQLPSSCGFPGVTLPPNTVVYGAGTLAGKTIDFQIDQSGHMATQIDVAVNNQDRPVALILGASEPTIWNIGWTAGTKIVAVFASGYHRQRVAGLLAETPLLIDSYEDKGPCSHSQAVSSQLKLSEGVIATFKYGQITAPEKARVEQGLSQIIFARPIERIFKTDDGKVLIGNPLANNQHLVTSTVTPPKSFYDKDMPLAGQAGLDQAERNGILRRATLDDAAKWINALKKKYQLQNRQPPDIPPDLRNAYVVLKRFSYPAGLYGGNSATFYIPEGVPQPKGNYGHSKIYDLNSISLECSGASSCGESISSGAIGKGSTERVTTTTFESGGAIIFNNTKTPRMDREVPSRTSAVSGTSSSNGAGKSAVVEEYQSGSKTK